MKCIFILIISFFMLGFSVFKSDQEKYNDCILESMKGVTSDVAAREIRNSCYRKYLSDSSPSANSRKKEPCVGLNDNYTRNIQLNWGYRSILINPGERTIEVKIHNNNDFTLETVTVCLVKSEVRDALLKKYRTNDGDQSTYSDLLIKELKTKSIIHTESPYNGIGGMSGHSFIIKDTTDGNSNYIMFLFEACGYPK